VEGSYSHELRLEPWNFSILKRRVKQLLLLKSDEELFDNIDSTVVLVRGSINATDIFSSGDLIDSRLYKFKLLFLLSLSPET
jgi:hypothetical protein